MARRDTSKLISELFGRSRQLGRALSLRTGSSVPARKPLAISDLEQRVLYSATPIPVPADAEPQVCDVCETAPTEAELSTVEQSRALVVVDPSTPDYEQLVAGLAEGGQSFDVVVLDAARDGIEQITEILESQDLDSIGALHIVSHGSDGVVHLGSATLNNDSLAAYAGMLGEWEHGLSEDADILFYGCDLAATEQGEALVRDLAILTGADVAASDDLTGHSSLGGDWELEFGVGQIDAGVAFDAATQAAWTSILPTPVVAVNSGATVTVDSAVTITAADLELTFNTDSTAAVDLTLNASDGTLRLTETGGLTLIGGDWDGGSTFTVSGAEADILNALSEGVVFEPTAGWSGATQIGVSVDAEGTVASDTIYVDVIASLGNPSSGIGRVDLANGTQDEANANRHAGVSRSIDTNVNGQSVAVWTNETTGRIHFATMAIDGAITNTGELPGAGANSAAAAVAVHSDGTFVVVWEEGFSGFEQARFAKFNADGTANTTHTPGPTLGALGVTHHAPTIAMNANGDYVIAYQSSAPVGVEIQRFASDGTAIDGSPVAVAGATAGEHVAVGLDADLNVMVAWNDSTAVHLSRYDGSFSSLGTFGAGVSPVDASLAMNDAGEAVLAYRSGAGEIRIQRISPDGSLRGPEMTGPVATDATVSIDQSGNFVVAHANAGGQIAVQRYSDDGTALGSLERVDFGTTASLPAVSMLDPSNIIAMFSEQNASADVVANFLSDANSVGPQVALAESTIFVQNNASFDLRAIVTDQDTPLSGLSLSFSGYDTGLIDSVAVNGTGSERTITVTPVAGASGSTTVDVQVSDGTTTNTVSLTVVVNDLPTNIGPAQARTLPGQSVVFARAEGNQVRVSDADSGTVRVTIEAQDGLLSLGDPGQVTIVSGADTNSGAVTFEGTIAQVNAALDGLTYTPDGGFVGRGGLKMTTNDLNGGIDTDMLSIHVGAELQTTGEFVVNTTTAGDQSTQGSLYNDAVRTVSILPDGGYVITWTGPDTDGDGVYAKIFNADGSVRTEEFRVATTTTGSQRGASVDSDSTGRFVITWTGVDSDGEGVFLRRFQADGTPIDATEIQVNADSVGGQKDVHLAVNGAGDGVIVWHGESAADADGTVARRFSMDSGLVGSDIQLNETTSGNQLDARVAINRTGDFAVVWQQDDSTLMFRRYNADGTAKGGEQVAATHSNMGGPAISMADDGSLLLGYDRNLFIDSANFVTVSDTGVVGETYSFSTVERRQIDITTDGSGSYYVVFRSSAFGASGIQMRELYADGSAIVRVHSDIQISTDTNWDERMPAIDMSSPNNFVVTWTSDSGDGDGTAVYAKAFGTLDTDTVLFSTKGNATTPDTADITDGTVNSLTSLGLEDGTSTTTTGQTDVFLDIDAQADSTMGVSSLHRVSRDMLLGTGDRAVQLGKGDLLFTVDSATTISGLDVEVSDVVWARTVPGGGSYLVSILFDDLTGADFGSKEITALTLVERDTLIGDTVVGAGNLLFTPKDGGGTDDSLYIWHTEDVGSATTGYSELLLFGTDIGLAHKFMGVELIEQRTEVGGVTLEAGTLVVTTDNTVTVDGVTVQDEDLLALRVATTTAGTGGTGVGTTTTTGNSFLLMDGSEIGLGDGAGEELDAVSIIGLTPNVAPVLADSSPTLPGTDEDTTSTPFLASTLLTGASDVDGDTVGIAVTETTGNGTWQYRTNGGSWTDVGSVSSASSLLLQPDAELRYQPDGINGETAAIKYRGWDQSTGAEAAIVSTVSIGGATAFSTTENTASLAVAEVNDRPVIDAGQSFAISEASGVNSSVGTVTATDDGPISSLNDWTIQSGNTDGIFQINAATGEITVADVSNLDFDTLPTAYTLLVTVEDGGLTSLQQSVEINITDANDTPPEIDTGQVFSVSETATNGTVFGTIAASDTDTVGSMQNWQIVSGNPGGVFSINASGQLVVADETALDHETIGSYTLSVRVSDGNLVSATETVVVNVNDVNEHAPVVTAGQSFTIAENSANGSVIDTVLATDADATTNLQSWTLTSNPGGLFAIDSATGQLTVANASGLNYESQISHTIEVRVSDNDFNSVSRAVTINLTDVNEFAPEVPSGQSFSVAEGVATGTVVGTLAATDGDATKSFQNWTITGNPGGLFAIDADSGQIRVANGAGLDHEATGSYTIEVQVSDDDFTSVARTVTINLTDVNEHAPVITAGQVFSVPENSPDGTVVGSVAATDADSTESFQNWTLTTNPGGLFAIDSATGEITVANGSGLDREAQASHTVEVRVSDDSFNSVARSVTINLSDVNDEAPVITPGQTLTVSEIATNGTSLGFVAANDADGGALQSWAIVGGNTGTAFAINPVTGEIIVADETQLDFDLTSSYTLQLTVSDGINVSTQGTVVVNVQNHSDNAPIIDPGQVFTIAENSVAGSSIGTVDGSDADGDALGDWMIVAGNDHSIFAIDAATGELTVANSALLDHEFASTHTLTVRTSDGGLDSADETIRVDVSNVGGEGRIRGQVFEDVLGDGLSGTDNRVSDVAVYLYRDTGTGVLDAELVRTVTTAANGYRFNGLADGTYFVVVDSKTITSTEDTTLAGDVWAEQTYGSAGSLDGGSFTTADGNLYGGRYANRSDDASSLATAEHVTRVEVNGTESGVNFGFSFNVVTNTLGGDTTDHDAGSDRTVQGSMRQFIQNANAIDDVGNRMRFTPATATNTSSSGNDWWTVTVTEALPTLTDDGTIIDGTVWRADTGAPQNVNTQAIGRSGTVGVGADGIAGSSDDQTLKAMDAPDLAIVNDRSAATVAIGLDIAASDIEVRNLAITGFGDAGLDSSGNIRVGQATTDSFTGVVIEGNILGATAASFAQPETDFATAGANIVVLGSDAGTIQGNLIGFSDAWAIGLHTANDWLIAGNQIAQTAVGSTNTAAIEMAGATSNATISGNLIARSGGFGIDTAADSNGNQIVGNTIQDSGLGNAEEAAIRLRGSGHEVSGNTLSDSRNGVIVIGSNGGATASTKNSISRNEFDNIAGLPIDLVETGGTATNNVEGDGLNVTNGYTTGSAHDGLDAPTDLRTEMLDGVLHITGTTVAGGTVEIYTADGDGRGEQYVATVTADSSGRFVYEPTDTSQGAYAALVIDGDGNTSEFSQSVTPNQAPSVSSANRFQVAENQTFVANLVAVDNDGPDAALSWSILGGRDAGRFVVSPDGALSFATAPDFETPTDSDGDNIYIVVLEVEDGEGATTWHRLRIQVTPVNDNAPTFVTPADLSVKENQTGITTIKASDTDLPAIGRVKYTIVGGDDSASFTINPGTGDLSFAEAANFEAPGDADGDNVYSVVIQVTDGTNSTSREFRVEVGNVNEAPTGIQIDNSFVMENATGATIGSLAAIDPDAGATHTFSVSDNRFEVIDGRLQLSPEASLDFETSSTLSVEVKATDQDGLMTQQMLELQVGNQLVGTTTSRTAPEDSSAMTIPMATLFSDVPAGEIEYSVRSSNSALASASVVDGGLQIVLREDAFGDGTITVQASVGGETATTTVDLTVTSVNDAPIRETADTAVEAIMVLDVATGGGLLKHASDVDDRNLVVELVPGQDVAHGVLMLNSDGSFEYTPGEGFEGTDQFQYRVSDGELQSEPITVALTVQVGAPVVAPNNSEPVFAIVTEVPTAITESADTEPGDTASGSQGGTAENTIVDVSLASDAGASTTGPAPSGDAENGEAEIADPFALRLLDKDDADEDDPAVSLLSFLLESDSSSASAARQLTRFGSLGGTQSSESAQIEARASVVIQQQQAFTRQLAEKTDRAITGIERTFESHANHQASMIQFGTTGITGLSVGYIFWLLRGGSLVASMLTTIPAWRMVDPLPIVDLLSDEDDDQDSLDSLIERGQELVAGDNLVAE